MPFDVTNQMYWTDSEPYFQTQYRILQSRGLARRVVTYPEIARAPELRGEGPVSPSIGRALVSARSWIWTAVTSAFTDTPPAELPAPDETATERTLTGAVVGGIEVVPIRGTQLVDVSFVSTDPQLAADAANALVQEYVTQNLENRLAIVQKSLDWLTGEIQRQQAVVEQGERALADYRESQNALSLDEQQNIVVSRLNQLNTAVTSARTTRLQRETLYNQVQALGEADLTESLPTIIATPQVQQASGRLLELQREQATLSQRYGERHPDMVRVAAEIEDARRQLQVSVVRAKEAIRSDYEAAVTEERNLSAALEAQKNASMDLDRKSVDYTILDREAGSNRQVYEQLLQRENELRVTSNSQANNVQIVDLAEVPNAPFSPRPGRELFIAILLGLGLSIGTAFGLNHLDDTIKTPEDITNQLRLPFLGLVPAVKGKVAPMLFGNAPHDFGEAFRAIRTSLVFTSGAESTRIILVTSAQPFEGKTTTSCNLAMALALSSVRVLLIEADMRRPGLHQYFGLQNTVGLSHLLTKQSRIRDAIQRTSDPNLFVMTAGVVPPNPSELLASGRMKDLIKSLASSPFDWVIIDTPPVLAVTDAVVLAPQASGVVFVLGSRMTQKRQVERAVEMLMASSPKALGVVLNRVDFDRDKYYYSHYYGYQYTSYYGSAVAS